MRIHSVSIGVSLTLSTSQLFLLSPGSALQTTGASGAEAVHPGMTALPGNGQHLGFPLPSLSFACKRRWARHG